MRKMLVLSALALTSVAAVAGGPDIMPVAPACCFDGFYVGAGIGAADTQFKNRFTRSRSDTGVIPFIPPVAFSSSETETTYLPLSAQSVLGSVFLGYGKTFNAFYLGAEGFANFAGHSAKGNVVENWTSTVDGVTTTGTENSFYRNRLNTVEGGIDARIGYQIAPCTLPYVRVGVAFNRIRLDANDTTTITTAGVTRTTTNPGSTSRSRAAWRVGGGVEQMLFNNFALRADYIYTNYGSINRSASTSFANTSGGTTTRSAALRVKTQSNSVLFSLVYHLPWAV